MQTTLNCPPGDGPAANGDGRRQKPALVSMTQAELNALIDKAYAKGARRAKREGAQAAPAHTPGANTRPEEVRIRVQPGAAVTITVQPLEG